MRSHPAAAVLMRISKSIILATGIALLWTLGGHAQQSQPPNQDQAASPNDIEGGQMFATSCGFCHQDGGRTTGKGPKLAGTTRDNDFLAERIRKGKPGAMPAFGNAFSESQIMAIVAYIRSLEE
ncbi:cytochrome c [Bradyrhizobium sp. URHD0069]|uniref:c-type cytochrome n=1 Tax=Bradyrhizobium sp. URHD0069 TaxID=1380355 RepID=UPI000A914E90|nr:cytochrome c [Bradyrhizobium sp. URHD0069]